MSALSWTSILRKSAANESNSYWSESKCLLLSRFPFGVVDSNPTPPAMPWNWRVDCFLDQLPFLNLATFIMHPAYVSYFKRNHLVSEDCITFFNYQAQLSFICNIHNYTEYNQQWNVFSAFNPSNCTHTWSSGQPMQQRPGSSWGFGALLKGLTSFEDNSCRSRDSNPQPRVTSATLYPFSKIPIFIIQTFMQINWLSQYINKCFCLFVYELQLGVHYLRVKIVRVRVRVRLGLGLIVIIFW